MILKNLKYSFFTILLIIAAATSVHAQEFNCQVTVNSPGIQMSNKQVFTSLENSIEEFFNSRRWTNDNFDVNEKIDCNIVINITSVEGTNYQGTFQIQSSRPTYGTNYNSQLLNVMDKFFSFGYIEFQPLEFQEGRYVDELTAILSYYAYVMLGYDYDSFSELGGSVYFQKAQTIVNAAQSSASSGWSAIEKNGNRYHLINQILEDRNINFRRALYMYHRLGMDIMASDIESGLNHALDALQNIQGIDRTNANLYITRLFFDAKARELADLFAQAGATQKYKAKEILLQLDVTNRTLYNDRLK